MVLLVSCQWFDVFVVFMHISEAFLFIFILHVFTTKVLTVSLLCVSAALSDIWVTVFYAAELEELRPQLEFVQRHEIMKNGSQDQMLNNPVTVPAAAWRKDDCVSVLMSACCLSATDRWATANLSAAVSQPSYLHANGFSQRYGRATWL